MMAKPSATLPAWLGYVFFVVYGSLVPLNFRAASIEQAWHRFQDIPFLNLGVESRADWIANGVLYLPVGVLTAQLLIRLLPNAPRIFALSAAFALSAILAFGVEFAQLFFPPRTVSLNDLLAECIGGVLGAVFCIPVMRRVERLRGWWQARAIRSSAHLLEIYVAAYFLFCLFPYDLLLSAQEFNAKFQSDAWGFMFARGSSQPLLVALRLGIEVALTLPLGFLCASRPNRGASSLAGAAIAGLAFGLAIEIAQLLIATGITQGVSVLTRIAGAMLGLALWRRRSAINTARLTGGVRRYTAGIVVVYLLLLLAVNGWFSSGWHDIAHAVTKWDELRLIPFYYHYYTTEAHALVSLASVWLMYTPIAILCWAQRSSPLGGLMLAALIAFVIEASKLFLRGLHPDPTNIFIAGAASWVGLKLAISLSRPVPQPQLDSPDPSGTPPSASSAGVTIVQFGLPLVFLALVFAGFSALQYPAFSAWLFVLLTICAIAVWFRPVLALVIIPAAFPILDLAPWSGRFYWDEFDLLMLVCLAVGFYRCAPQTRGRGVGRRFSLFFALLALSLAIATVRGLTPLQWPDINSFSHYYSPYNALRIVKGGLWAFAFVVFLRRVAGAGEDIQRAFAVGMSAGLALTVGVVLWERAAFVGLFDFASDYRVTGPFSAMHKGGAYIECYLAVATAFVLLLVLQARRWSAKLFGILLLLGATYCVMVTFSRNGYAALAVVLVIGLSAGLFDAAGRTRRHWLIGFLACATVAVTAPIFYGQFAQERMAQTVQDLAKRKAHWMDALDMRDLDLTTALFGMGMGRFPETHYWRSATSSRAGTLRLASEEGNNYLRLGSGMTMYFDQFINPTADDSYELELDVRSNMPSTSLRFSACEKWMLTSIQCASATASSGASAGKWTHVKQSLAVGDLASQPWYAYRPIKLALYSPGAVATVDIDNVRLVASEGDNLIANGDFSGGFDNWFFSTDVDPPWHIHSLPVAVLFDQGWLGVLAWGALLLAAFIRAARSMHAGRVYSGVALAALAGFVTSGSLNTLIDAPRFLWLLLVLVWLCGMRAQKDGAQDSASERLAAKLSKQEPLRTLGAPEMHVGLR